MIIGFYIKPDQIGSIQAFPLPVYETIVFVYHIDSGIDHQTAQQNQWGKASGSEIDPRKIKSQKSTDKRNRNQRNNHQRLPQRLEQDRTGKKDNHHNQQNQPILGSLIVIPSETLINRPETDR